jgi:hypothetical protein
MSHVTLRKFVFDAARTVKDRRARDEEIDPRPDDDDLDEAMKAEDVVALVERFLENCSADEGETLMEQLRTMPLPDEQGVDARRGARGARHARGTRGARGAGDFRHPVHAGDAALPHGVKSASERFPGAARVSVPGWR